MIVKNEEARLEACLQSVAPYVDEMVVLDTGSTDRTREIAYGCGAQVYDYEWTDSFADARNRSLDLATGKWAFWMDADDVLSPECGVLLRALIRQAPGRDAAFHAQVRIPPGPGEFSPSVVDHIKLFPIRPDIRFEHRIHEQVLPSLRKAGIAIRFSDLFVTHQHYDRSPAGQATKRLRDFRLLGLDLADHPNHPFILFNLGMTHLFATKEFEVAAHYLRRSLSGSNWQDSIVRKAFAMLTTAHMCQDELELALMANERGRQHYPEDAELLFQAGQILDGLGRLDEARAVLERLVTGADEPYYRSVDTGFRSCRGMHALAHIYRKLGNEGRFVGLLQEVVAGFQGFHPARVDLAAALALEGRIKEARDLVQALPQTDEIASQIQEISRMAGVNLWSGSPD